jgi:hypothetical protein
MPTFELQTADGRTFEIEAPSQEAAISALQGQVKPKQAPAAASKDDPITAEVRKEFEADKAAGVPTGGGLARQVAQGITFNAADDILAAAQTPLEMIRRGTWNPITAYQYAKAREDIELEEGRKKSGLLGTAAEILGGVGSGVGLAGAGLTAARALGPGAGLAARAGASAADGLGYGAFSGLMEGNSLGERAGNAAIGGAGGALIGGAMPILGAGIKAATAPIVSNIRARTNPEGYAATQLARAVTESGRAPQQLADEIATAGREGQGMFTLADALGNPGQRMLSSVTRAPGPGRTAAVEFLENRQAGQGRRVANAISEGFEAPATAQQATQHFTRARDQAADAAYDAVRGQAGNVDPTAAIRRIDQTLRPGVNQVANPRSGIADDSVESALSRVRARLTDDRSVATEFQAVMRARDDLADEIQKAVRAGANNKARLLRQVRGDLDNALEDASTGYRAANAQYAQGTRVIDAVDDGRTAAMRGRSEDVIPRFQGLTPEQQAAFRFGYADPLIEQTQGAAMGVNKARPFTSEAFQAESSAMAPGAPLMQRRIGRENQMFETRNQALGGSRTADNLADSSALGVDPSIIRDLAMGRFGSAARGVLSAGSNALSGNTTEVRTALARMLLSRGQATNFQQALQLAQERIDHARLTALLLTRGAMGGGAQQAPVRR